MGIVIGIMSGLGLVYILNSLGISGWYVAILSGVFGGIVTAIIIED